jgi:hypothetical protein
MSDSAGLLALLCAVLGVMMTFHRHLAGRIVGVVMVLGPLALMFADDWMH